MFTIFLISKLVLFLQIFSEQKIPCRYSDESFNNRKYMYPLKAQIVDTQNVAVSFSLEKLVQKMYIEWQTVHDQREQSGESLHCLLKSVCPQKLGSLRYLNKCLLAYCLTYAFDVAVVSMQALLPKGQYLDSFLIRMSNEIHYQFFRKDSVSVYTNRHFGPF